MSRVPLAAEAGAAGGAARPGDRARPSGCRGRIQRTSRRSHRVSVYAGLFTDVEKDTTCCYAVQDKMWVHDPGQQPWEVYVVKADSATYGADPELTAGGCRADTDSTERPATSPPITRSTHCTRPGSPTSTRSSRRSPASWPPAPSSTCCWRSWCPGTKSWSPVSSASARTRKVDPDTNRRYGETGAGEAAQLEAAARGSPSA